MIILKLGSKLNIAGSVYDVIKINKKNIVCNSGRVTLKLKLSEVEQEVLETKNWYVEQV